MSGEKLIAVLGLAVVVSVFAAYLKSVNPALAAAVLAAAAAVFTMILLRELKEVSSLIGAELVPAADGFAVLIKGVFVSAAAESAAALCRDNGFSSLAVKVDFAGRLALVSLAVPLVAELFDLLVLL